MMKKTKKKKVVKTLLLYLKAYSESLSIRVTQLLHFVTSHRNEHSGEDTTLCHSSLFTGKKHSTHKLMTSQETGHQTHDI